jgi:large subunit ribosomal protein L17
MFRNMATSLIEEERIQTTAAKAKELRSIVEKLITLGSRNAISVVEQGGSDAERAQRSADRVAAVRQAGRYIMNRDALQKLFGEIAERFVGRPGGYTRVLRTGRRLGDNAEMAIIELLPEGYEKSGAPKTDSGSSQMVAVTASVEVESPEVEVASVDAEASDVVVAEEASVESDSNDADSVEGETADEDNADKA